MMDFDEEAIAADGYGGAGGEGELCGASRAVAGVNHDGQVAALF